MLDNTSNIHLHLHSGVRCIIVEAFMCIIDTWPNMNISYDCIHNWIIQNMSGMVLSLKATMEN